jgi:hypothetical protein
MGNVSIFQRFRRRLTKNSSGTISVSIPLEHAMKLGWDKGIFVDVELHGQQLIITEANVIKKGAKK